jgi:hypothetical protein
LERASGLLSTRPPGSIWLVLLDGCSPLAPPVFTMGARRWSPSVFHHRRPPLGFSRLSPSTLATSPLVFHDGRSALNSSVFHDGRSPLFTICARRLAGRQEGILGLAWVRGWACLFPPVRPAGGDHICQVGSVLLCGGLVLCLRTPLDRCDKASPRSYGREQTRATSLCAGALILSAFLLRFLQGLSRFFLVSLRCERYRR